MKLVPLSQQLVEGDANPNEAIMSEIKSDHLHFSFTVTVLKCD